MEDGGWRMEDGGWRMEERGHTCTHPVLEAVITQRIGNIVEGLRPPRVSKGVRGGIVVIIDKIGGAREGPTLYSSVSSSISSRRYGTTGVSMGSKGGAVGDALGEEVEDLIALAVFGDDACTVTVVLPIVVGVVGVVGIVRIVRVARVCGGVNWLPWMSSDGIMSGGGDGSVHFVLFILSSHVLDSCLKVDEVIPE